MIYFDHAATTPTDPKVVEAMKPYFTKKFGNASTIYKLGQESKDALENSRKTCADLINAKPQEIVFTSGGTESDNLAIQGLAKAYPKKKHIITSNIEHAAIKNTCKHMESLGYKVTYLPVDKTGTISLEDLKKAITKDTLLVSIMTANNEIGTIQPIKKIGKICKEKNVFFHTDAVQAFGKVPININDSNIDLLSASSHKIYGPKGVGLLFVRKGIEIKPLLYGGGHEEGNRSGTENIPGVVGFAKAVKLAKENMAKRAKKEKKLREKATKEILKIEGSHLNTKAKETLPGTVNFWFEGIEGESLVLMLSEEGVAASTGSACSTGSLRPSHVLLAIGLKPEQAHGSLRISFGKDNTEKDLNKLLKVLPRILNKLRALSPTWKK